MTDAGVATALALVLELEREFTQHCEDSTRDHNLPERDASMNAARQTIAVRKSLETWIGLRAMRAALPARP